MTEYQFIWSNPDHLANGRPLAPEDRVVLNAVDEKANASLIESGALVALPKPEKAKPTRANKNS